MLVEALKPNYQGVAMISTIRRRWVGSLAFTLGFLLVASSPAGAVIIVEDPSVDVSVAGIARFATFGDLMVGMEVTASFLSGFAETVSWVATGPGAGGAFGTEWSLTLDGDSFAPGPDGASWVFTHARDALLTLKLDGEPGFTVFDRTFGGVDGTPDSELGLDFDFLPDALEPPGTATYSRRVAVGVNPPVGDLWQVLTIDFTEIEGLQLRRWEFEQDTDNDVRRQIPEPASVTLLGLGLAWLLWRRKRS